MSAGLLAGMVATPALAGVEYKSSTKTNLAWVQVPDVGYFAVSRSQIYNGDGSPGPWDPPRVIVYMGDCFGDFDVHPHEYQWTPTKASVHTVTPCGPIDVEWVATGPLERFNDWKGWSPNGVANCSPPEGEISVHDKWLGEQAPAVASGTVGHDATSFEDAEGRLNRGKTRYMQCGKWVFP